MLIMKQWNGNSNLSGHSHYRDYSISPRTYDDITMKKNNE